jgi:hypothetical protein
VSMGRALTAVGGLLVLALLVLGLVIYVNRDETGIAVDNLLAEDITRAIGTAEDRGADVDLGRIASFKWDELVIARRDVTGGQLTSELGRPWTGRLEFRTGDLLIFLRKGELARFADYRGEGRFAGIQRPFAHLKRADAVFRVRGLIIRPLKPPS